MMKKISVVIVNYNAGQGLIESVKSVISDAHEVVVVDNASSDGSIELLGSFFNSDPKLKIIKRLENGGFAKACNHGFSFVSGEFILFINPDCELQKGAMIRFLEVIQSQLEIGIVGGLLLNKDGSEQAGGRRAVPTPWRTVVRIFGLSFFSKIWPKLFNDYNLHKKPLPEFPIEVEAISGACMFVKRSAINSIGLLDENYFLHCEDLDWCMRFRIGGWKIFFVPDAKMLHHKGVCSKNRPFFVEWHKHIGMLRFYKKFFRHQYPGPLMYLVHAGVYFRFILIAIYYSYFSLFNLLSIPSEKK